MTRGGFAILGRMKPAVFKADALLLLAAVVWGTGFVAQRMGMEHVGPMTFNGIRFAIGALVLLPVIYFKKPLADESAPVAGTPYRRGYLAGGILAGSVLFVAASLQQIGLIYTTAGKAGFITGLYVVFVPIIGLFLRHRIHPVTWAGAGLGPSVTHPARSGYRSTTTCGGVPTPLPGCV